MTTAEHSALDPEDDAASGGAEADADVDGRSDGRGGGRGPVVLGVLGAVMVAFSGVVWSAYHQGVREGGRSAAPVIRAAEGPFKITPQERGGATTPHLDKEVFSRFDGDGGADAAALRRATAPLDTAPRDTTSLETTSLDTEPEAVTGDVSPPTPADRDARDDLTPETSPPSPAAAIESADPAALRFAPSGRDPAGSARAPTADAFANAFAERGAAGLLTTEPRAPAAAPPPSAAADPRAAAARDGEASPPPRPAPTRPITAKPAPPLSDGGRFAAQLGSYRSARAAEVAWDVLNREAASLFAERPHEVVEVDLGQRGVFFRLYVPGFAERARASAYCEDVLERGYGCIVAGR